MCSVDREEGKKDAAEVKVRKKKGEGGGGGGAFLPERGCCWILRGRARARSRVRIARITGLAGPAAVASGGKRERYEDCLYIPSSLATDSVYVLI